ncbi:MAG TPA: D-alanyl-D-alanine carboxypeptidase family protein [Alphaproteobacteria bacterium]|jgi:D-alanyl-D-alanine carboxypeptidase
MLKTSVARAADTLQHYFSITRISLGLLLGASVAIAAAPRAHATIASSILMDEASGRIIRAYRADAPHPPASLAKIMTLYLAFEALEQRRITLGTRVPISYHAAARSPSKLYLRPGYEVTVEQLILAMTVRSANDAASAMGEFLAGGSEYAFAQRMTAKARELGMRSTTFRNASGLPAPGAYTSAHDMAILARAIHTRFPQYSHYFARRYFQWGARTFRNTNRLLHARADVTGMKTGYTRASGFNVVVTARHGQQKVISVVLGGRTSSQRFQAAAALLGTAYRAVPPPPEKIAVAARVEDDEDEETADSEDRRIAEATKKPSGFSLIPRAEAGTRTAAPPEAAPATITRFGIQIGSYRNYRQAQSAAKRAYYSVPGVYRSGSTRIAVVAMKQGRRTQYAARVLGFNQSGASQTCRVLARRGLPCHTLSYSLQSAALHQTSDVPDDDDDDRPVVKPKPKKKWVAKKRKLKRYAAYRR